MADAYTTPVRRLSGRRSGSLLGADSELTSGGTQILHAGLQRSGRALALQVLGIYRYIADPDLRRVLPPRAVDALDADVFDLLLSDGQMKMKVLLAPTLNHLVWQGRVRELDIVELDDYELISVQDKDDRGSSHKHARSVCVVHELTARADTVGQAAQSPTTPRAKIVYSVGSALLASPSPSTQGNVAAVPDLQFISEAHIRDHGALPVAGSRLYYLSLYSDDYPAEWEPVQHEPLSPISLATPWAEWNRRRRYCTDIFNSTDHIVHTLREVNVMTSLRKRSASEMEESNGVPKPTPAPPPMIGSVSFKSNLVHLGVSSVVNEFPFMFHIVLSDRERSVEVAFFGSMAAKNFLILQDGDLVQLEGYTVSRSVPRHANDRARKLFYYPHLSTGVVSHVPEKYWQLLETTKVLEKRAERIHGKGGKRTDRSKSRNQSAIWLRPKFLTSLEPHDPEVIPAEESANTYFDFAGVVTYVGRMHRHRPRREFNIPTSVEPLRTYRWVKLIDGTSKSEFVVRLYVNSQPASFNAIQAGDIAMLSNLRWIRAHNGESRVEFATSSVYTTLLLNDAVDPYQVFVECSDAFAFAKKLGDVRTQYSAIDSPLGATTESWLEGSALADYEPFSSPVTLQNAVAESLSLLAATDEHDVEDPQHHWISSFNPQLSDQSTGVGYNFPFEEVATIGESMDALSHRYIRVHVALHGIRVAPATANSDIPEIEFLVTDGELQDRPPQAIRLRSNVLLKEHKLPTPLDDMVATDAGSLARLLTPSALSSLNTTSILRSTELPQFSPAKTSTGLSVLEESEDEPTITFEVVKDYILKNRLDIGHGKEGGITIALHLYRMPHGELDLWIDGINL